MKPYLIRNDGTECLKKPCSDFESFCSDVTKAFEKIFDNVIMFDTVDIFKNMREEISNDYNCGIISLDPFFQGDYNISVTRHFSPFSQEKHLFVGERIESSNDWNIEKGQYVIVDDDSITGSTIDYVMKRLPDEVEIIDTLLVSDHIVTDYVDIVDLRDFIDEANYGGLTVNNYGKKYRLPYHKGVDLMARAKIEKQYQKQFILDIEEANRKYFS